MEKEELEEIDEDVFLAENEEKSESISNEEKDMHLVTGYVTRLSLVPTSEYSSYD